MHTGLTWIKSAGVASKGQKLSLLFLLFLLVSCQNFGQLTWVADLSKSLKEVSGNEMIANSELIWMVNDSGNYPEIFGVTQTGIIEKVLKVAAKNHDWEDLTSDEVGNLYIGDFGNNRRKRKELSILKIENQNLFGQEEVAVSKIRFEYPMLAGRKKASYDAEAFFYYQNYFYIFTKSRQKKTLGRTLLFKVPNVVGKHTASFVSEYVFCHHVDCRITAADISEDGTKVVLLSHQALFVMTNFEADDFFASEMIEIPLEHVSQKEGICFKDDNTLFITDEYSVATKGYLYKMVIN